MTELVIGAGSEAITSPGVSCSEKLQVPLGEEGILSKPGVSRWALRSCGVVTRACPQFCVTTGQLASVHLFAGKWTC